MNRYAYVRGNPVAMRDPSGMSGSPALDNTEPIQQELQGLVTDYVKSEAGSDRERQLREAIEILRGELGQPTPELTSQPAPEDSFVGRAANDPRRVRDFEKFGDDIRQRADRVNVSIAGCDSAAVILS